LNFLINILRDAWEYNQETVAIDSDNVVDSIFLDIHQELGTVSIYIVLDIDTWERNPQQFLWRCKFLQKLLEKIFTYIMY
jgi:hypothetical protein